MEQLLQKIKEYTATGSPTVGQLIELNDVAKIAGVKRSELEKLITQSVAEQKNNTSDFSREAAANSSFQRPESAPVFNTERPKYDNNRLTFERELEESRNFDVSTFGSSTFEAKEVSYAETNRNFEDANKTTFKNTNYPDSKEREEQIKSASKTVEEKLEQLRTELQFAVNARALQGLKEYTELEFFELTNQIRQRIGLEKLKKVVIEETPEVEPYKTTIEPPTFDEHLEDEFKVEAFEYEAPKPVEIKASYDEIIAKIKKEIQSINESNFHNGYCMTESEYITLHNSFFDLHQLPHISRIDQCVIPLPVEHANTQKTQASNQYEYESASNYSQSREEEERQLNIVRKKEEDKKAAAASKAKQQAQQEKIEAALKEKDVFLQSLKATRVMAFIALGLAILISGLMGLVLGGFTLFRMIELNKKMNELKLNQNPEVIQLINTAKGIAIGAAVVGCFKIYMALY